LFLDAGIPDLVIDTIISQEIRFEIPDNAFKFTGDVGDSGGNTELTFEATQVGGTPLPEWLTFDAGTQTFTGEPPSGETFTLEIKVIGRDEFGNEAVATFRMVINSGEVESEGAGDPGNTGENLEGAATEQQEQARTAQNHETEADDQDGAEVVVGDLGEPGAENEIAEASPASVEQAALTVSERVGGKPSLSEQFDQFGHGKFRTEALRIALGNELRA